MVRQAVTLLYHLIRLRMISVKKNEILLVSEHGNTGGTRTYFIALLKFLHLQGYKVSLLQNADTIDTEIADLLKQLEFKTIQDPFDFWCTDMENIPEGLSRNILTSYQFKELLYWCRLQFSHRFSGIIFNVSYPEMYLYSFLLPVKIRYILHTVPQKKSDQYKQQVLNRFLSPDKQIITVSAFAKKSIEHYWLNDRTNEHVRFIYNHYIPKYQSANNKDNQKVRIVLTIGTVISYKNPLLFIEVAKRIIAANKDNATCFIWAGDGSMLEECRDLTKDHPQIQFIGHQENVETLYEQATVFYQPSQMESHGIAVLGAMYHHLPCVVSDQGGLKESVVHERTGFVVPVNDPQVSVEKINLLLQEPELCKAMGETGYVVYALKFNEQVWEKEMVKQFTQFI